jgi:hypothetical protein
MAHLTGPAQIFEADTTTVDSTAQYALGTRAQDTLGNEYIYALGVEDTELGSWVTFDEDLATTLTDEDAQGRVGIAMAAITAGKYG